MELSNFSKALQSLDKNALQLLMQSRMESLRLNHKAVYKEHILLALLTSKNSETIKTLASAHVDSKRLRALLINAMKASSFTHESPASNSGLLALANSAVELVEKSNANAQTVGCNSTTTSHIAFVCNAQIWELSQIVSKDICINENEKNAWTLFKSTLSWLLNIPNA